MQRDVLWVGNSNVIRIRKLQDVLTGAYLNGATVYVTVFDEQGDVVGGENFPVTAAYQSGDGNYAAALSSNLEIEDGQQVTLVIESIQSLTVGKWEIPMLCLKRVNDSIS